MKWNELIRSNLAALLKGERINVSAHAIAHPRTRPDLFRSGPGWPYGQRCDYFWPLSDGSRIHVQCFSLNGGPVYRIHRDKYDPDRNLAGFAAHALLETPIGPISAFFGLLLLARAG